MFYWQLISVISLSLMLFRSAICQFPCNRRVDKNGFSLTETEILCDYLKTGETKPLMIGKMLNNFDVQSLGSESNSWVLRFRDRFGKVRSLVFSNLEKSKKLLSIPRKIFGNFEEVIGDSNWNPKLVKDSIGKLWLSPKKVDFDGRPPSKSTFSDIFRSVSTIWKPKKYMIHDLKKNANDLVLNNRRMTENREKFGKSMKSVEMPKKVEIKVYDPKYLEIISRINHMSDAIKNAEKELETKAEKSELKIEDSIIENNSSETTFDETKESKKFTLKRIKQNKNKLSIEKPEMKRHQIQAQYSGSDLTKIRPSETDQDLINPTFISKYQALPPLKRIPLSSTIITVKPNIWPNKLIMPKMAPPTPLISPTSVLSLPIDFAQTILPEPTSDFDTFTYRDAVIADDSQQFSTFDKDLNVFAKLKINDN